MSRSASWLTLYEQALDKGMTPDEAAVHASQTEADQYADYCDMKRKQRKEDQDEY